MRRSAGKNSRSEKLLFTLIVLYLIDRWDVVEMVVIAHDYCTESVDCLPFQDPLYLSAQHYYLA